jgi:hypothetical protein
MAQHFEQMPTTELADIWKSNDRSAWSDEAFETIQGILCSRGIDPGPQDEGKSPADAERQFNKSEGVGAEIRRAWRGEEGLATTYWLFGVCGIGIFRATLSWTQALVWINAVIGLVALIYSVFAYIAIWRSAKRYRGPALWANLARVMVVVSAALLILSTIPV